MSWAYSYGSIDYYPGGNPEGPNDGYPGSLFGSGHDYSKAISEVTIPVPIISKEKDLMDLRTAKTLQPFANVVAGTVGRNGKPTPGFIAALSYLPKQGMQKTDKLYFAVYTYFLDVRAPTHGWCDINLSKPSSKGMWRISKFSSQMTCRFLFEIPKAWAEINTPGKVLLAGGYRQGFGCGKGPNLFAVAPWEDGNPPAPNSILRNIPLLKYGTRKGETIEDFQLNDGWYGGEWVEADGKSAVVLVGSKDMGKTWYGYFKNEKGDMVFVNDGKKGVDRSKFRFVARNKNGKYYGVNKVRGSKGWKSDIPRACLFFYNPADLSDVAKGKKKPYEPQLYARLDVTEIMFKARSLSGAAYDRENGLLYATEPKIDRSAPIVHVWKIRGVRSKKNSLKDGQLSAGVESQ